MWMNDPRREKGTSDEDLREADSIPSFLLHNHKRLENSTYICSTMDFPPAALGTHSKALSAPSCPPLAPPLPSSHCLLLDLSAADPGARVPRLFLVCFQRVY